MSLAVAGEGQRSESLSPARGSRTPSTSGDSASSDIGDEELDDDVGHESNELSFMPSVATPTSPRFAWPFLATRRASTDTFRQNPIIRFTPASLPHEVLLKILRSVANHKDLLSAVLTCKSWCQCGVELLWHKPSFTSLQPLIKMCMTIGQPNTTFPYAYFIRRLNFAALATDMTDLLVARLNVCERLERLTLAHCNLITNFALSALFKSCHSMVALDLTDCKNITDAGIAAVARSSKQLQGLNLSGCSGISDDALIAVSYSCFKLRRVKLRGLESITDAGITALAKRCTELLEIDVVGCPAVTDVALWEIFRNSTRLRELNLNGSVGFTSAAFPICENNQILLPPSPISPFETTPSDSIELTPVPSRNFEHLRYLDLTSLTTLTDEAVSGIVTSMPKLRNFILAKCDALTDVSIYSICKLGKHLHYLHLGHVTAITDPAVKTLARSCTRLRYIDLTCCTNLTDMSVFELASNLHRLKRIGLVRVTSLTDNAIQALVERTSLERIHLSYCEKVSVSAVTHLLNRLHRLTHLSLTGVPAFRRDDLQHFCRQPPKTYNDHQRGTFCVFSGKGISALRRHLNQLAGGQTASRAQLNGNLSDDEFEGPDEQSEQDMEAEWDDSVVSGQAGPSTSPIGSAARYRNYYTTRTTRTTHTSLPTSSSTPRVTPVGHHNTRSARHVANARASQSSGSDTSTEGPRPLDLNQSSPSRSFASMNVAGPSQASSSSAAASTSQQPSSPSVIFGRRLRNRQRDGRS